MITVEGGKVVVTGSRMNVISDLAALIIYFKDRRHGDFSEAAKIVAEMGRKDGLIR